MASSVAAAPIPTSFSKRFPERSSPVYASESKHKFVLLAKRVLIVLVYSVLLVVCLLLLLLYCVFIWPAKRVRKRFTPDNDEPLTNDWWALHSEDDANARDARKPKDVDMRKGVELRTCYITMRDGVKLATDVWIPKKALAAKGRLPVIFHQARYYRSATLRWPFNMIVNGGKPINFINDPFFKTFLQYDMILVSVDVRGTGASFGTHPGPWSLEEQQDSLKVLDWIDRQPWSNGKVGLWGMSYEGTSAFFTSLLRHPTVVCCCPMFFFWEVYDDLSHPGGIPMRHFSHNWQGFNDSLDSGWVQSTGWMARIFLEGVSPVTLEDPWGYQVTQALGEHRGNWSLLHDDHIRYMDDKSKLTGRTVASACASEALHQLLTARRDAARESSLPGAPASGSLVAEESSLRRQQEPQEQRNPPIDHAATVGVVPVSSPPTAIAGDGDDGDDDDDDGGDGGNVVGGGGGDLLKKDLPYYLHVSGWLDASANAAVMAFMTVPCRGSELLVGPWNHGGHQHVRPHHITSRSRFDFRSEVSGFFVRRLSSPSDDEYVPNSNTRGMEGEEALGTHGSGDGSAAVDAVEDIQESSQQVQLQDESSTGEDGIDGIEGANTRESVAAVGGVQLALDEGSVGLPANDNKVEDDHGVGGGEKASRAASALAWKGNRPRVRFYTHQEERWHEADTFPSTVAYNQEVVLNLGLRRPPPPPTTTPIGVGLVSRLGHSWSSTRGSSMARFRGGSFPGVSVGGVRGVGSQREGDGAVREGRNGVRMTPSRRDGGDESDSDGDDDSDGDEGAMRVVYDAKDDGVISPGGDGALASPHSLEGRAVVGGDAADDDDSGDDDDDNIDDDGDDDMLGEKASDAVAEGAGTEAACCYPEREGEEDKWGKASWNHDHDADADADAAAAAADGFAREPFLKEPFPKRLSVADNNSSLTEANMSTKPPVGDNTTEHISAAAQHSQNRELPQLKALPQSTRLDDHALGEEGGGRNEGSDSLTSAALGGNKTCRSNSVHVEGEGSVGVAAGGGGVFSELASLRDRLSYHRMSSREWLPFRKPALTLSQDYHEEKEVHELDVDIENDRDGEGVSRWAAMTEFLSLVSYQMDGLRSNHLRFTSPALKHDLEVTGFPVVTLWVSAADDLPNLDVFVYLQAVRPRTGLSIYVTEGCFRAEHRKEKDRRQPVEVRALAGVPIHSYLRADAQPLEKGTPVELKFKLMPTSFKFLKGQRVRLSVGGADARHFHPITRTTNATQPTPIAPANNLGSINNDGLIVDNKDSISLGDALSPVSPHRDAGTVDVVDADALGAAGADGVVAPEVDARITKRVLRVHTGGEYASSVSLPVPRSHVGGLGGRPEGGGRQGDAGSRGGDRSGARDNVATPRTENVGQTCWSRRARSHSSPDMSSSIHRPTSLKGSLQRRGRWSASIRHALSGTGTGGDDSISDKERTEFRSDAGDSRREDAILKDWGEHDVARIFVD